MTRRQDPATTSRWAAAVTAILVLAAVAPVAASAGSVDAGPDRAAPAAAAPTSATVPTWTGAGGPAPGDGVAPVRAADATPTAGAPNGTVCAFDRPAWRDRQAVAGVVVQRSLACRPDNPFLVAAVTKGTNRVPGDVLAKSGLASDAVRKHTDRDGDGDPDVIEITLEVHGLNEFGNASLRHEIAPGIAPAFWVFAPKTRGMVQEGTAAAAAIRMPSPPIRVEAGDTVRLTLENTHYLPHTIHLHGVDHPYAVDGAGNDGVPQTSERPVPPGDARTYEFQPRQPGTMFYHCHVTPSVHVTMGLNGMFVVTENRSDNRVQTINVGAGKVRHPSKAVSEEYAASYDLQYQDVDAELHRIPTETNDPRLIAKRTNRVYDRTDADPDYFLLNGRSFPYTVRESLVVVEPGERYRLRVLNGGSATISLHTHGHKFTVEAYDGVELAEDNEITRDVATVSAAQRVDLALNTTNDGLHSYGPGVWFAHDHREDAVTNDGIGPGGTVTMIAYESYLDDRGIPRTETDLSRYFSERFYRGEVPKWDDLEGARLGAPNGTAAPTTAGDGHGHSHDGGQSGQFPVGRSVLGLVLLVIGLAVGLVLGREPG